MLYNAEIDAEGFVVNHNCGYGSEKYSYKKNYGVLDKVNKCSYNVNTGLCSATPAVTVYGYDKHYDNVTSVTANNNGADVGKNTITANGNTSTNSDGKAQRQEAEILL